MDRSKRGKPRFPKTFVRDERGGAAGVAPGGKPVAAGERGGERAGAGQRKPFAGGARAGAGERKPFVRGEPGGAPERRPFVAGGRGGPGGGKPFVRGERSGPPGRPTFARDDRRGPPERRPFVRDELGGPPGRKPFVRDERGGAPERKPFVPGERRGPGDYKRFDREGRAGAPARKPFVRTAWRGPEDRRPSAPAERGGAPEPRPFMRDDRRGPPERRPFVSAGRSGPGDRKPFASDERRGPPGRKPFVRGERDDRRGPPERRPFVREERSGPPGRKPFERAERSGPPARKPFVRDDRGGPPLRKPFVARERSGPGAGARPGVGARPSVGAAPRDEQGEPQDSPENEPIILAAGEHIFPRPIKPRPSGAPPLHWRAAEMGKTRTGLARALSKLGYCSRNQAWEMVLAGRVELNGVAVTDGEHPVVLDWDQITVDGVPAVKQTKVYLLLNKPRGLVTTASDEQGRPTVFECLGDFRVPHLSAVGRLDQASEGLLLFTNDHAWGAHLTSPERHVAKTYHVQVDRVVDEELAKKIQAGAESEGEHLAARKVSVLRHGEKTSWLEIVLDEGRNRQIRRLLAAFELEVLRLVRVAIGDLLLGTLAKGAVRRLTVPEIQRLGPVPGAQPKRPPRARPTERQVRRRF